MRTRCCVLAVAPFVAAAVLPAQTLDDIRDDLRAAATRDRLVRGVIALVDFSQTRALAGARYRIDNGAGIPDTRITTFQLPWSWQSGGSEPAYDTFGESAGGELPARDLRSGRRPRRSSEPVLSFYVEGNFGYLGADIDYPDLYSGQAPAIATAADAEWRAFSATLGAGPRIRLGSRTSATLLARTGAAYLENDAHYSGPGAPVSAALLDGILFNWNATLLSVGGAVQLDRIDPLGHAHGGRLDAGLRIHSQLRYDGVWSDVVRSTDAAQEGDLTSQALTARVDLIGPTGWTQTGRDIEYRVWTTASHFPGETGDALGVETLYQVGAGLETAVDGWGVPLLGGLSVSGAFAFGDDIRGFSVGLGVSF